MPAENFETEGLEKIPDLKIAQWCFELTLDDPALSKDHINNNIMREIQEYSMGPFYEYFCKEYNKPVDQNLLKRFKNENQKKLEELDKSIKDAEENLGDTEVRQCAINKAHYLSRIGDRNAAVQEFKSILEKVMMPGTRLDCIFHLIRIGFFWNDSDIITEYIEKANKIIEEGGDWDRRNRLKVYRGLYAMSIRDFDAASKHFMDAVATFTSYELMDYKTFICYAILSAMIALKRQEVCDKVVKGSEIQEVLHSLPNLNGFVDSLYNCQYAEFFVYLTGVEQYICFDRYLAPHARFYVREMRVLAYTQHLNSYSSISMESMASTFGVSTGFLDQELARLIAAGRLSCKIDKVASILITSRCDSVNSKYQALIKQGDLLLNRVQKLSQVINI